MVREKRKKMSPDENGGVVEETTRTTKKKLKKEKRETSLPSLPPPPPAEEEEPTTEEVEEFYAILRRMDVAMRYLKGRAQKRPTPAEETTAVVVRIGDRVEENKDLNLNEMPSDSTN